MTFNDIAQLGIFIIGSVGGSGVIIVAVARWWGKYLAESLLESERSYHREELERLKGALEATNRRFQAELDKTVHAFKAKLQIEIHAILDLWKKTSEVQTAMQVLRPQSGIAVFTGNRDEDEKIRSQELARNLQIFTEAHNSLLDAHRAQSAFVTKPFSDHIGRILNITGTEITQIRFKSASTTSEWYAEGKRNYSEVESEIKALSETIRARLDELVITERNQL